MSLGLLSDKRKEYGVPELERSEVRALFDMALFMEDDRKHKPDPEGLRRVCSSLNISPDQTLYIGDSPVDVKCARSLGAASGAALWGSLAPDRALAENPDYIFHSVSELVGLFT